MLSDRDVRFFKGVILMATISSYDSSSLGVLFSSITSSSSSSGTSDLLGISYSDYASILNGSYAKLVSAYYSDSSSSISTSSDSTTTLTQIQSASDDLQESAEALLEKGTKSVFKEVTTTDEDGNTTTGYDTDAIYSAVSSFVDDYNTLVTQAGKSSTSKIQTALSSMVSNTKAYESLLSSVGITINSDNTLTIDEETFKSADMSKVKTLFNESGSYGYQTMLKACTIDSYASIEASKSSTYTSSATYTYNYSTGTLYSSYT